MNITKSILYTLLKAWELEWEGLASVSDLGYTHHQFLLLYHYLFVVFLEIKHKHLHLGQGQVSLFELLHHSLYIDNYTQNFHLGIPRSTTQSCSCFSRPAWLSRSTCSRSICRQPSVGSCTKSAGSAAG